MKATLFALAVLGSAAAFGSTSVVHARSVLELASYHGQFVPPGQAKEPGEPARDYAPGHQKKDAGERRCHRDVQRHLHDTYSHAADHYHRRGDCQPVIV